MRPDESFAEVQGAARSGKKIARHELRPNTSSHCARPSSRHHTRLSSAGSQHAGILNARWSERKTVSAAERPFNPAFMLIPLRPLQMIDLFKVIRDRVKVHTCLNTRSLPPPILKPIFTIQLEKSKKFSTVFIPAGKI